MAIRLYLELLRKRQVQVVVAASVVSGLTVGLPLAIVLMIERETGNFASAGAVTATMAITAAIFGPLRGRVVDRRGQTRTLPVFGVTSVVALIGLVVATEADAPLSALLALAAVAGAASAPLVGSLRALWVDLVDNPDQLPSAYGLHAVILELFFISGPLAAAALIAVGSPALAVLALAACELIGVIAFTWTPVSRAWRGEPSDTGRMGALASPGMRTLTLVGIPVGALFGMIDVAAPAFTKSHGAAAAAGLVIAALAVGSMIGGLAYGPRAAAPGDRGRRYSLLLAALAILLATTVLADSIAVLIVLVAAAGVFVAPITALGFGLIDDVAPTGTATEATSWMTTAYQGGVAIGTAAAGPIVDHIGTATAFAAASAFAGVAAIVAFARRRSLSPSS